MPACRYMLTAIYLGRGALSCLLLMGLGESTSLLQNGWYMARFLRQDYKACAGARRASAAPDCILQLPGNSGLMLACRWLTRLSCGSAQYTPMYLCL